MLCENQCASWLPSVSWEKLEFMWLLLKRSRVLGAQRSQLEALSTPLRH